MKDLKMKNMTKFGIAVVALALTASPILAADNYGSLISTLQSGSSANVGTLGSSSNVNFVTVSSVKGNGSTSALDNALKKNGTTVAQLQTQISANAALKAKIEAAGFKTNQVVAIKSNTDGSVMVFVDDRG